MHDRLLPTFLFKARHLEITLKPSYPFPYAQFCAILCYYDRTWTKAAEAFVEWREKCHRQVGTYSEVSGFDCDRQALSWMVQQCLAGACALSGTCRFLERSMTGTAVRIDRISVRVNFTQARYHRDATTSFITHLSLIYTAIVHRQTHLVLPTSSANETCRSERYSSRLRATADQQNFLPQ